MGGDFVHRLEIVSIFFFAFSIESTVFFKQRQFKEVGDFIPLHKKLSNNIQSKVQRFKEQSL